MKGERRLDRLDHDPDEAARLWRRNVEVMEAAEGCGEALEALHGLVLGLQEPPTPAEQQARVRALQLRRAADAELGWLGR